MRIFAYGTPASPLMAAVLVSIRDLGHQALIRAGHLFTANDVESRAEGVVALTADCRPAVVEEYTKRNIPIALIKPEDIDNVEEIIHAAFNKAPSEDFSRPFEAGLTGGTGAADSESGERSGAGTAEQSPGREAEHASGSVKDYGEDAGAGLEE